MSATGPMSPTTTAVMTMPALRVGEGWDVHALVAGRPLILGGVTIPHDRGLLGHSDADALLHAITDALFGAAALGDIGRHFPDTALEFMMGNVNMPEAFVRYEVNRYLGWPGQAPSYKVGQRLWENVRDEVRAREGAAFDIKAFHKRALDLGGVGLDTLRATLLG